MMSAMKKPLQKKMMNPSGSFRILILDNTRESSSFGSPNLFRLVSATAPRGAEMIVRRTPEMDFSHDLSADAIVISGSATSCLAPYESWVGRFDGFVTRHIEQKTPILGVCFGHQAIARCLFRMDGKKPALGRSGDAEIGWQTMRVISKSVLFQGLGREFVSYQSHYEEVSELPPGTRRTAESDRCRIQAFEMESAPVFGIQFHPEHGPAYAEEAMAKKLKNGERPDWVLNPGKSHELYDESIGKTIFGNFFDRARAGRS
jgi:GMP synthase-like glutamine amidotransferase